MPDKGFQTITVPQALYDKVKARAEQEKKSIAAFTCNVLASYMEADERLSRYAPFIELKELYENSILLFDSKVGHFVEVHGRDKQLFCTYDQSSECMHVSFCFAIPQVRKVVKGY